MFIDHLISYNVQSSKFVHSSFNDHCLELSVLLAEVGGEGGQVLDLRLQAAQVLLLLPPAVDCSFTVANHPEFLLISCDHSSLLEENILFIRSKI